MPISEAVSGLANSGVASAAGCEVNTARRKSSWHSAVSACSRVNSGTCRHPSKGGYHAGTSWQLFHVNAPNVCVDGLSTYSSASLRSMTWIQPSPGHVPTIQLHQSKSDRSGARRMIQFDLHRSSDRILAQGGLCYCAFVIMLMSATKFFALTREVWRQSALAARCVVAIASSRSNSF